MMRRGPFAVAGAFVAGFFISFGAAARQARPAAPAPGAATQTPAKVVPPAAVTAAFKKAYPNATIRNVSKETANGKVEYEIESMDGTQARDLVYRPDGTVVLYEELIPESAVPAAVVSAIKLRYPKATVSRCEKLFQDGTMNYELVLKGAAAKEVILTPAGQWISPAKARSRGGPSWPPRCPECDRGVPATCA